PEVWQPSGQGGREAGLADRRPADEHDNARPHGVTIGGSPDMPDALDATAQAELVRAGQASPSELVDEAIGRIEKLNPELNAVIHPLFDKARRQAASELPDGPFRGVPMVL